MTLFRDDLEFGAALAVAADRLGVIPAVVEKDYWVTQALRELSSAFPDDWVFKGGTSLSKGYDLLSRFSEDIDVLVLKRDRGRNAADKLMKGMGTQTAAALEMHAHGHGQSDRGMHRSYELRYRRSYEDESILPFVLLEMGVRGGPEPSESRSVGTMLAPALELDEQAYADLAPFDVAVLHPGRTLLEKLGLLHVTAIRCLSGDVDLRTARIGRHFYDVHQVLGYEPARTMLENRVEVARILGEAADISIEHFGEHEPRPSGGYAESPAFGARTAQLNDALASAYRDAERGLRLGREPWPSWDEVQARVGEYAHLL